MDAPNARTATTPESRLVWVLAVVVMFGLAVAASSESVRVWTNPEPTGVDTPAVSEPDPASPGTDDEPDARSQPGWIGDVVRVIAIGLFGAIIIGGAFAVTQVRPAPERWRWAVARRRHEPFAEPLPDAGDRPVRLDAATARAALAQGPPRNAIVACWMQLEHDVAAAGLRRLPAETSGEYVQRVVSRVSVDAAPIGELASLYREARFSDHELGAEQRDRAEAALDGVVAALHAEVPA